MYKIFSVFQWIWFIYEQVDNVFGLNYSGFVNIVFFFYGDWCVNCLINK